MGTDSLIGVLDSAQLAGDKASRWLAESETADYTSIRNPRRQAEWLAGRIAAKYAFLHRGQASGLLSLAHITREMIEPAEDYREIALRRHPSRDGGAPSIGRRGAAAEARVAVSHAEGIACAFIGRTGAYAVDLEFCQPRIAEFYRQNFTACERAWVAASECDEIWLYTLLWSAKECLLKTPQFASLSLWDMPSIDLRILSGGAPLGRNSTLESFTFLDAEVSCTASVKYRFELAVAGTADFVLTAIPRLD